MSKRHKKLVAVLQGRSGMMGGWTTKKTIALAAQPIRLHTSRSYWPLAGWFSSAPDMKRRRYLAWLVQESE